MPEKYRDRLHTEHAVLDIGDDFNQIPLPGFVDDHVDLLNAIEEANKFFHLPQRVVFDRRGDVHVLAADLDLHANPPD